MNRLPQLSSMLCGGRSYFPLSDCFTGRFAESGDVTMTCWLRYGIRGGTCSVRRAKLRYTCATW